MKPQINDIYIVSLEEGKHKVKLTGFSEDYQFCHFDILDGEHKVLCRELLEVENWTREE